MTHGQIMAGQIMAAPNDTTTAAIASSKYRRRRSACSSLTCMTNAWLGLHHAYEHMYLIAIAAVLVCLLAVAPNAPPAATPGDAGVPGSFFGGGGGGNSVAAPAGSHHHQQHPDPSANDLATSAGGANSLVSFFSSQRPRDRRQASRKNSKTIPVQDQVVLVTDNPFLIPNMPERRKLELLRSIQMNLESPYVQGLHLLNLAPENGTSLIPGPGNKLHVYELGWRSMFFDAIRYANAALPRGTMFAIANADIAFAHDTVRLIARMKDPDVVITLSRHEVHENETANLHTDPALSQDAWFMRTPFPEDPSFDFPMGTLGSDNKLAYLYTEHLNKTMVNWCADVVIWHFHASQIRSAKARLPQPYRTSAPVRVNISMLSYEWQLGTTTTTGGRFFSPARLVARAAPLPHVLRLDLPRIADAGTKQSRLSVSEEPPAWTPRMLRILLAEAQADIQSRSASISLVQGEANALAWRRGLGPGSSSGDSSTVSNQWFFFDLPWVALARSHMLGEDGLLIRSLRGVAPPEFVFERACTFVSAEALRELCHGAPEWRRLAIGVIEVDGSFSGLTRCPPGSGDALR